MSRVLFQTFKPVTTSDMVEAGCTSEMPGMIIICWYNYRNPPWFAITDPAPRVVSMPVAGGTVRDHVTGRIRAQALGLTASSTITNYGPTWIMTKSTASTVINWSQTARTLAWTIIEPSLTISHQLSLPFTTFTLRTDHIDQRIDDEPTNHQWSSRLNIINRWMDQPSPSLSIASTISLPLIIVI